MRKRLTALTLFTVVLTVLMSVSIFAKQVHGVLVGYSEDFKGGMYSKRD